MRKALANEPLLLICFTSLEETLCVDLFMCALCMHIALANIFSHVDVTFFAAAAFGWPLPLPLSSINYLYSRLLYVL